MSNINKEWIKEDEQFLIDNYRTFGLSYCSEKLHRTKISIVHNLSYAC